MHDKPYFGMTATQDIRDPFRVTRGQNNDLLSILFTKHVDPLDLGFQGVHRCDSIPVGRGL